MKKDAEAPVIIRIQNCLPAGHSRFIAGIPAAGVSGQKPRQSGSAIGHDGGNHQGGDHGQESNHGQGRHGVDGVGNHGADVCDEHLFFLWCRVDERERTPEPKYRQ
ncbi:hypothetical protein ACOZ4Y_05320 [Komagataeibacter rhaeticus]|uniref:hypothetical protein n=1 Tax=Komagataeibacter rhaeticus TaxID=215221 RepID=UPI001427B5AE|nr:hypothetical protein [Komagataeibacter rhaeticus]